VGVPRLDLRPCRTVSSRLFPWVVRAAWAALPLTAGAAFSESLHHHTGRTTLSAVLWVTWAASLLATLAPHPISLTFLRTIGPAAVIAAVAAAAEGHPSTPAAAAAVAWTAVCAVLVFVPMTAMGCVNGPAYPNERRYPLATPGALFLGPLEVAWAAATGLPAAAILLLAAHRWVAGAIVAVVGAPLAFLLARSLHGLSRRWVVFVPAGLVLHDPLSLVDPVLFERKVIERLAPAPAETDSLDLTQRAPGLALELVLKEKVSMARVVPRHEPLEGASARLLFTPSRPGAVLAEAERRHLPVR
jgi:hypothetical protein